MEPNVDVPYLQPESWDAQMPARLRWLRENDPVRWSEVDQLWILTKYADVEQVSKHQEIFTSAHGVRPGTPAKIGLIDEGEPRHAQLRRLINRGFTPRMVTRLEEKFLEITTSAIDAVAAAGECEFVTQIAVPLPLMLIAEMMGIDRVDYPRFHRWSDDMIQADGSKDPAVMAKAGMAFVEYSTYLRRVIDDRRASPADDLVSILTGAKEDGTLVQFEDAHTRAPGLESSGVANDELLMLLTILLVAGNETTRNGISGGMQLLIENPGEREKLLRDPSLIPSAVEEMVRMVSPVHSFSRTVLEDAEIRGRRIRKGQQVLMIYPSANRDADVYDDPDTFRVDRNPAHLGFGVGTHFCLGANLARMEMRVAFRELLRRLPDMAYSAGGPVIKPAALVRACMEMRVRFTPESLAA